MKNVLIRLAVRLLPLRYRDDILCDLQEKHDRLLPLLLAIVGSARDARRARRVDAGSRAADRAGATLGIATDLAAAWRVHRRNPGTAVGIVAILTLAIGLNTAIFSVVDAVLNRPLPFADAERVQFLWTTSNRVDKDTMSPARALDFRERVTAFEHASLVGHISMTVTGRGAAERWFGASVSSSFFDVLQATPALGRTFTTDEVNRDVVVLSHRLWVDQFGSARDVIGRTVTMQGRPRTIVGVMPESFFWPSITSDTSAENPPMFWACAPHPDVPERPLVYDEDITRNRTMGFLRMVTRLRADRSVEDAQAEVSRIADELAAEFPATDGGRGAVLVDARTQLLGTVTRPMWFILLASTLVIVAACVNVGSLMLVRHAGRRREFAVRTALGAGRARLARLVVTEAALLSIAAGLVGLILATGGLQMLVAATPTSVGRLGDVAIDLRSALWTAALGLLTSVILGAVSAVALWRDRSMADLKAIGSADTSRTGLRQALIALQVALAVALLVGASLFGRSLWKLQHVDVGLNTNRLLTFDLMLTGERAEYQSQQLDFYSRVFDGLRALPGVTSASGAITLPIGGDDFGASAFPEGRPIPPPGQSRRIGFQVVWDNWFDTLGQRLESGRDFGPQDTRGSDEVVIINRALADLEWPGENPIGRRLKYAREGDAPWLRIVGVVSNVRHTGPGEPARPELYLPYSQMTQGIMAVAVRTAGDPLSLVSAVRSVVAAVDSTQPASGFSTMSAHLERAYGRARFLARLTMLFALVAASLTLVGVYGVSSHAVAQRTREFGVRAALGARPGRLVRDVLTSSLAPVWIGAGLGLAVAFWLAGLVTSLLFDTSAADPIVYGLATGIVAVTAALAALIPARRAARIDPVTALRDW
jgi:putative ABC transport system permease protein